MRANAFTLTLASFVAGIFGFFLRWLQNLNGFTEDGLLDANASISGVFLVYSIIVVLAFALEERIFFRRLPRSSLAAEALAMPNFIVRALSWLVGAVLIIGSLVFMFTSDYAPYPAMQRVTGALGIFSGVAVPFIVGGKDEKSGGHGSVASLLPVLFCCIWLVSSYRVDAQNPIRWDYAPALLAIIALLLSFYYIAAYYYKKANPARCLFALQTASYLSICVLIDKRPLSEVIIFGACAAACLCLQFTILHNALKARDAAEAAE